MKTFALAIAILAAAPLAASADVSKEDIKKLAAAGVGDEVILSFIRSNGPVARLSADDLVELKQAGASEKVLAALVGGTAAAPRRQMIEDQVVDRIVERPVYVPSSTYVYETPTYYSSYYPYSYSYSTYWPSYYYSSCYPRYSYSYGRPSIGLSFYGGSRCSPRSTWGVSIRR